MPLEEQGTPGGAAPTTPESQPTPAPVESTPPPSDPSPAPAPSATPPASSWRDQMIAAGIQLPESEEQSVAALSEAWKNAQRFQQMQPYVQSYLQHAGEFNEYLRSRGRGQQQVAAPAQPQQNQKWWSEYWTPPEYNPAWERLIKRDEQGNLTTVPGAPPDIIPKYLQYAQWRQDQADRLMQNPFEFFEQPIRRLATEEAARIVQAQLADHRDQVTARQFVAENTNWLYEHDQNGQRKYAQVWDPSTGGMKAAPVLSHWGQRFEQHIRSESERQSKFGYWDIEEQKRNAIQAVKLEFAEAEFAKRQSDQSQNGNGAPAQTQRQANNGAFLAQHANGAARPTPAGANVNPAATPVNRSNFKAVLAERFKAAGITD